MSHRQELTIPSADETRFRYKSAPAFMALWVSSVAQFLRKVVPDLLGSRRRRLSALVTWDMMGAAGAVVLGYSLSPSYDPASATHAEMGPMIIALALVFPLGALALGLYERANLRFPFQTLIRSLAATLAAWAFLLLLDYVLWFKPIGRWIVCIGIIPLWANAMLGRMLALAASRWFTTNVFVLGEDEVVKSIHAACEEKGREDVRLVGALPPSIDQPSQVRRQLLERSLDQICSERRVQWLVVQGTCGRSMLNELEGCLRNGMRVLDFASFYEEMFQKVPIEHIDTSWLIQANLHLLMVSNRAVKRAGDIVVALIGLMVTAPFWPLLALLIKASSPGPVFYRQDRVGENGSVFAIIKFRTMRERAEHEDRPVWAAENDNRVTPVGKVLRRLRLDEIPQFLNVLRGHMSIIGPRPERPEFVEELGQRIPSYRLRHLIKPGITGLAQISFRYAASEDDSLEKLRYDLYYIKYWGFFLDLQILFRTVGALMKGAR